MNLEELYLKRQSTRKFSNKPVLDEQIERVCYLASLAPSACNSQPWKMFAINGEKAKVFNKNVMIYGRNKWAETCPAFIVINSQKADLFEKIGDAAKVGDFTENDVGILCAHIVLAAENEGLQTCILGIRDEAGIAEFLCLPKGSKFPLVIAIGYADESVEIRKKVRKNFNEVYTLIK